MNSCSSTSMNSYSLLRAPPPSIIPFLSTPPKSAYPPQQFSLSPSTFHQKQTPISSKSSKISAALKSPRGFGPLQPQKTKRKKKLDSNKEEEDDDDDDDEEGEEEAEQGIIPEIVTNRMMKRMAFSVGIPLFVGLLFFPFFYYLKVALKIDVPTWMPVIVSFFFFGSALVGVSYGIVSSSWDPLREGSLLGWKEARKNWPVFWQSLWVGSRKS